MSLRTATALGLSALLATVVASAAAPQGATPDPTARERGEIAVKVFDELLEKAVLRWLEPGAPNAPQQFAVVFDGALADKLHNWSVRRMEAEHAGAAGAAAKVAAVQGHLDRMVGLESGAVLAAPFKKMNVPAPGADEMKQVPEFSRFVLFFRLEAEARLAKEKAS